MLTDARDESNQEPGLGCKGGGPVFRKGDLDCAVQMHRAGLACRLLTSAVSLSSAECSSHLATGQGNSRHHQLNTVRSNCTVSAHPIVPSTHSSAHLTSNMVLCAPWVRCRGVKGNALQADWLGN